MSRTHDLTEGSLPLHFKRLAVPAAIGMVFTTLYNVVDVFFAGLIGTDARSAQPLLRAERFPEPLHLFAGSDTHP